MTQINTIPMEKWEMHFKGWVIVDCVMYRPDRAVLLAREDLPHEIASLGWNSDTPTRMIHAFLDGRCGSQEFEGIEFPRCGSSRKPVAQALLLGRDRQGNVYAIGGGEESSETIKPGADNETSFFGNRLVCIDSWTYALGMVREVHKRVDIEQWQPLMNGFDQPRYEGCPSDWGFNDMDGPNENTLYAVGGKGDVWRYDGTKWHWCDFPSNQQLATVTVAPDGQVYISGDGGSLWVGKEHSWKPLAKAHSTINYNDSVWFNGQLWLCSDYRLEVWDGQKLGRPIHNGETIVYSGHMDTHENLLVVAGMSEVHAFDGENWHTLVESYSDD